YAIAVDAISFAASTGFMLAMRHRESRPERSPDAPRRELWPEGREGLRWVVGHPWVRPIAACTGLSDFFSHGGFAILVLYLVRSLHLSSLEVGIVFALGSIGGIVGALLVARIQHRLGVGPTVVGAIAISSSADFAFPLAPHSSPLPALILGLGGGT